MATALNPGVSTTASTRRVAAVDDTPAVPHPTYTRLKKRWEKCRTLWGSTQAVRDGGETYLPKFEVESDESYEVRKVLCAVFNGFKRTVKAAVGLLLEKEPELGDDMPPRLVGLTEDVDLKGTHFAVYARRLVTDYLIDGLVATLVDYPRPDQIDFSKASLAAQLAVQSGQPIDGDDEKRLGLRPYFIKFQRADVLNVVESRIDGVTVKVLVVLRETREEVAEGSFLVSNVSSYRVYRRTKTGGVTWERWEKGEDGNTTTRVEGPSPMLRAKRIPVSLLGEFTDEPPLEDLADLNIEHHTVKTGIRHLESLACVPTSVRIGADPDADGNYPPLVRGPRNTIEVPLKDGMPQRPLYWDSPDISVLEPANQSLQDIKSDMGAAGLAFLAPDKRAAETAEAKRIDAKAQDATLSSVGRAAQDHFEECYGFAGDYIGEPGGSITVNTEFEDSPLTAEEMGKYLDAYLASAISRQTFLDAWKTGKRLDESLDAVEEGERILKDNTAPVDEPDDVAA